MEGQIIVIKNYKGRELIVRAATKEISERLVSLVLKGAIEVRMSTKAEKEYWYKNYHPDKSFGVFVPEKNQ